MCSPVEIMTWSHHYQITLKSQSHSRVPECDGQLTVQVKPGPLNRMVTGSAGVQTDLSKVFHSSCRSICHSSEPQSSTVRISSLKPTCLGNRCSEHTLVGSRCLWLHSHSFLSKGDPKNRQCNCLIILIAPGWPGMPWFWDPVQLSTEIPLRFTRVNNTSQTVPQSSVPQQSTTSEPPRLVSGSEQLQEQGSSVEVAERIVALQMSSTRTIYQSEWALFEK